MAQRQWWQRDRTGWASAVAGVWLAGFPSVALAQIAGDGTLGTQVNGAAIAPCARTCTITGGTTRGVNLFHSFQTFSIPTGGQASFNNAPQIQNILTRVTGSGISTIDGVLSANGTANLFFLNPNGIVFGRNARLNLGGSLIASTANRVIFADGSEFSARPTATPPLLTVTAPIGLGFTDNPSRIVVQGNGNGSRRSDDPPESNSPALRVGGDRTLALVGGDLSLEGATLKTAGGRIELGSVAKAGVVQLTTAPRGFVLSYDTAPSLGNLQLTRATSVDASGNRGGEIHIRGRQITIQGGSQIEASTLSNAPGGNLQVTADDLVEVSGTTADNPQDNRRFPSSISADNRQAGQTPGALTITTRRLVVRNGARISASTSGTGVGGNLTVNAADAIELTGTGISNGGRRSSGLSVQTRGAGNAGALTLNTQQLLVQAGAEVSASTFGRGDGGNLTINAANITVTGTSPNQALRSRLVAEVGNPNEINNPNQPSPGPLTPATGKGGNLTIATQQLRVSDGAVVTVSSRTEARGAQGAGEISVTADQIVLDHRGAIIAESRTGQGGDIQLQVRDVLLLRHNSLISTTAGTAQAGGDGGNMNLDLAPGLVVGMPLENSDITANAFSGSGGRITIQTQGIFGLVPRSQADLVRLLGDPPFDPQRLPTNDITASSQFGINGSVTITTPDLDPNRGLVQLPTTPTDPSNQIDQSCASSSSGLPSRFTATGRGGLPSQPDEALRPSDTLTRLVTLPSAAVRPTTGTAPTVTVNPATVLNEAIVEAQAALRLPNGKIRFVAAIPTPIPYASQPTSVSCARLRPMAQGEVKR